MDKYKVINPYDLSTVAEYEFTTREETFSALSLVTKGKRKLRKLNPYDRYLILSKLGELIFSHKEKFAILITKETGKLIVESRVEVDRALKTIEIAAEEAKRITSDSASANSFGAHSDKLSFTRREPLGVVLCITPFNFPLNLALHKIAPAFAAGNTILLKPADCNFLSARLLVDLCYQAGMDAQFIQLITPKVETLNELVQNPDIQCVSFTGGTKTADKISKLAGRKKLLLELGGNDALVIFPDFDLDLAVNIAITGRFGCAGQKCTSNKRIFIHDDIYEDFKKLLLKKITQFKVGDPLKETTTLAPVISVEAANKIHSLIKNSIAAGAKCLAGGHVVNAHVSATVLEQLSDNDEIISEETFGPVMPLLKFNDISELIFDINNTPYGLQAGILTHNIEIIKRMFDEVDVGTVIAGDGPGFRQEHLPFGGVKASGIGREGIKSAMFEMSYIKQLIF